MRKNNSNKLSFFYFILPFLLLLFSAVIVPAQDVPYKKNAIAHNKDGWDFLARGDHFRAILSFKKALKQNPKYKQALLGLGKAHIKTEAYEESLRLLSDVLKLDKENVEAINGIGFAMTELGRYNDGLKYFENSLKLSEDNTEANYGIAYIYYLMDRLIWSKRKLDNILTVNPYHYESLLLMGDIKIREKRGEEAKKFVQRAIDANNELPDAYIRYGQLLLKDFKESQDQEYMAEAAEKFSKALAINQENLLANRGMGSSFFLQKNYNDALKYFQKTIADYPDNSISFYNVAVTYANMNDQDNAIDFFLKALKKSPSDSLLSARLEDFLILNEFAEGNPLRVKFSDEHFKLAAAKLKSNLPLDAIMHLNRSLLLNPLNRQPREILRDMYQTLNYNELFVNEQKILFDLYPENRNQDLLKIAVINRRDRIFHKAGFSTELPPRDVPKILVLNFSSYDPVSLHPDAGEAIANYITFTLGQFGRMVPVSAQKRLEISSKLKDDHKYLGDNLEIISDMARENTIEEPDFIVSGSYREGVNYIAIEFELLDFHTGVITNQFSVSETGKNSLPNLAIRACKRLYDSVPFKGRVLQMNDKEVIVNLGLIDGIRAGDFIIINKLESTTDNDLRKIRRKITLQVEDADAMICSAKPKLAGDLSFIDINDNVYPFRKQRAKLLEKSYYWEKSCLFLL